MSLPCLCGTEYGEKVTINRRGNAKKVLKDYNGAIADFTKAIEINPKYYKSYNNLAWLLATCQDKRYRDGNKAVELSKKAVNLDKDPQILDTLAASYAEAGIFDKAINTQKEAIELLEKDPAAKNKNPITISVSNHTAKELHGVTDMRL